MQDHQPGPPNGKSQPVSTEKPAQKVVPPYHIISSALVDGDVVPFLGAGVNFGVLPTGTELSRKLAHECSFPAAEDSENDDLAKVSSYFVEASGDRRYLRRYLRKTFCQDVPSAAAAEGDVATIHDYLARLSNYTPLLIVTTNYDDLTEAAFRRIGKPFDLVIHPTDRDEWKSSVLWWEDLGLDPEADARKGYQAVNPNALNIDLKQKTVIYKMHGTVNRQKSSWDSYVITEDDYVEFLARMTGQNAVPKQFMHYLQKRRFLFMGYGLRDWNFRVVLRNLRSFLTLKTSDEAFSELLLEVEAADPAIGDWLKKKIITPAQAIKMLESKERQRAQSETDVGSSESFDEEDDEPFSEQTGSDRSWAVQYNPTPLEKILWERRGVTIYDLTITEFVKHLAPATAEELTERGKRGGSGNGE